MSDRMAAVPAPEAKRELRRRMRELRRGLNDRAARSTTLWAHVWTLPQVDAAQRLMAFSTVPGEPEVDRCRNRWRAEGRAWSVPEDEIDPTWPDVVLVPGLAFTASGERLGQGGGWYDRFLLGVRPDCTTIGVCFREQLVAELPVEPHDIRLDVVVTDAGIAT